MVVLNLGVGPDADLEVPWIVWCLSVKFKMLKVWKVDGFDREMTLIISGSDFCSGSWNRSVVSFGICIQNLRSFGVDLIWFGMNFGS